MEVVKWEVRWVKWARWIFLFLHTPVLLLREEEGR
jgi:hypothetical protein